MSRRLSGSAMMQRAQEAADRRAARMRQEIMSGIETDFPDLMVRAEGEAVIVEGRDLLHRWLDDARLRDATGGER